MNRRTFIQSCSGGLCACAAAVSLTPIAAQAEETKPASDWRLPFVQRRYAALLTILAAQTDAATVETVLMKLGRTCAAEFKLLRKHAGDIDGFIREFTQQSGETITYDRERGLVRIAGPERTACFCPLVGPKTTATACACSLGWQSHIYESLLGREVKVTLKESVQRGDKRCVFEVRVLGVLAAPAAPAPQPT